MIVFKIQTDVASADRKLDSDLIYVFWNIYQGISGATTLELRTRGGMEERLGVVVAGGILYQGYMSTLALKYLSIVSYSRFCRRTMHAWPTKTLHDIFCQDIRPRTDSRAGTNGN